MHPEIEIKRYTLWNEIVRILDDNIILHSKHPKRKSVDTLTNILSMWISINLIDKKRPADSFFPKDAVRNQELVSSLVYLGKMKKDDAQKHVNSLVIMCNQAIVELQKLKPKAVDILLSKHREYFNLRVHDTVVTCHEYVWARLKKRYRGKTFEFHTFCLLLRYQTLMGIGHQLAMLPLFKDKMKDTFGLNFEILASPLNAYYDNYCSMFQDTDMLYGSSGSFYLQNFDKGVYIANPPYSLTFLTMLLQKIFSSVKNAKHKIAFIVGLPDWQNWDDMKVNVLTSAMNHKLTTYCRLMKNRDVKWLNNYTQKYNRIPSHYILVIQNSNLIKSNNINTLIEKFWIS